MTTETAPSPAQPLTTYLVRIRRGDGGVDERLVDARRETQVRDHLMADGTVTIARATTQQCVALGAAGVKVETAGGEGGAA